MKTVIALLTVGLLSTSASAQFGADFFPSMNFPTNSQWAMAMVQSACGIELEARFTGSVSKDGQDVIYNVTNENGEIVASAAASSTSVLAKKTCL